MPKILSLSEAENMLQINKHDLDEENIRQPMYMFAVTSRRAAAKAELARLEREKANLSAELDPELRKKLTAANEKYTEASLALRIRDMPRMRDLNAEIIDAQEELDRWDGACEAMRHRSYSLKELGEFYRVNYYSSESSGTREAKEQIAARNREAAGRARRGV